MKDSFIRALTKVIEFGRHDKVNIKPQNVYEGFVVNLFKILV